MKGRMTDKYSAAGCVVKKSLTILFIRVNVYFHSTLLVLFTFYGGNVVRTSVMVAFLVVIVLAALVWGKGSEHKNVLPDTAKSRSGVHLEE